ncbi:MAG: hypothetical protein EBT66_09915 [Bacteroidetes bacterium]|nr:hypothetical protein [Bacteroidota bacterium]
MHLEILGRPEHAFVCFRTWAELRQNGFGIRREQRKQRYPGFGRNNGKRPSAIRCCGVAYRRTIAQRNNSVVYALYTHQRSATFTRPLKELKRFQKIALNAEDNIHASEHKAVTFTLGANDFSYYDATGKPMLEPGYYDVWIGTASDKLPLHKVVKVVK